ncbi:MAG: sensor domain-containing diguanylate cyclase [Acidobacteriota bacterium]|jgi:diguanylate cyclase (GGDEF)-like protein
MDLQSLADLSPVLLAVAFAVVVLAVGMIHFLRRGDAVAARPAPTDPGQPARDETEDLRRTIWQLQADNRNLSNFFLLLPDFTKQLNSHLEKRSIAPLLIQILDYLFDPTSSLIFFTGRDPETLALAAKKGLGPDVELDTSIRFGSGPVGWVARHQVTMSETDFASEAGIARGDGPMDRIQSRVELCAAMVHDNRTLGVIALCGMKRRPKNEKKMLKMVADLGSIALNNSILFKQIQSAANSDGLTRLTNKRHFLIRMGEEIFKAEKANTPLSVFIFDIDHFKNYNDANGHLAGDEALKITGRLLRESTREDDVTARYGGEEFIVIFTNTPKDGAFKAAEKIRQAIENFPFPNGRTQPMGRVTISGGVASFPIDGRTSTELISAADQALYQAKNAGRNRVFLHETKYLSEEEDAFYIQRQEI